MRLRKHARLIAATLVVLAIVAVAMWPESMEVDVAPVDAGPMQVTIDEDGETRVRDRFVISAPVSGRLQRIELEPGDPVIRGRTVLVRLTPAESPLIDSRSRAELAAAVEGARAAVGQAKAEMERAAATLARARSNLRRQQELGEAGLVARETLETAETQARTSEEALRAAEFTVTRSEYELQLARARLQAPTSAGSEVVIVAPIDGIVLKRLRESESVVPIGEPLLEIGDPERLEIVADLLSTDAVRVPPRAAVNIEQWGGGQPLKARVRRVEPSGFMKVSALGVEEQRVNVLIDFVDVASAARALGDNYRVEVRIVVWSDDNVVRAPVGSLFRRGEGWATFVVEQERARLRTIQLGQRNDTYGQITSGLSAGQVVVLHPPDTLADGIRVEVRGGMNATPDR
jgi:HlyD family secretion protein